MVFCSKCDIHVPCEICWGTTDPDDHTVTGHTFLPDISERSPNYQPAVQHHRRLISLPPLQEPQISLMVAWYVTTTITRTSDLINVAW